MNHILIWMLAVFISVQALGAPVEAEYFVDPSGTNTIEEVKQNNFEWTPLTTTNLGYLQGRIWVRFRLPGLTEGTNYVLKSEGMEADETVFYGSGVVPIPTLHLPLPYDTFPLTLSDEYQHMSFQNKGRAFIDIKVVPVIDLMGSIAHLNAYFLFVGAMLVMVAYNLLMFLSLRDSSYLWYCVFSLAQISLADGFSPTLHTVFPPLRGFSPTQINIGTLVSLVSMSMLTRAYTQSLSHKRWLSAFFVYFSVMCFVLSLLVITRLANIIFEPSVSTAERVTSISGRGVGMDAVKSLVVKRGGDYQG